MNEGFTVSLNSKEADFIANLTEDDMKNKGIPIHAIVIAVRNFNLSNSLEKTSKKVGCWCGRDREFCSGGK